MDIQGKVAIVTGASAGIGRATALGSASIPADSADYVAGKILQAIDMHNFNHEQELIKANYPPGQKIS